MSDGRLACDFDVRDAEGNRLAKVAKNNVVHAAEGYEVINLARESYIKDQKGELVAKVEEIELDTIRITGRFCIGGHSVLIDENKLVSGGITMTGNTISGFNKAIAINPNSFSIGTV